MNPNYLFVAARAEYICEYCRTPERFYNFSFEVEHIIPPKAGGRSEQENLALSCRSCNIFKSNHLTGIDSKGNETGELFDPRNDDWDEHFFINSETFQLEAKTKKGEGTVSRLKMNNPKQVLARANWVWLIKNRGW